MQLTSAGGHARLFVAGSCRGCSDRVRRVLSTLAVLLVAVGGVVVTVAAAYWFLSSRGALRAFSAGWRCWHRSSCWCSSSARACLWVVLLTAALMAAAVFCAHRRSPTRVRPGRGRDPRADTTASLHRDEPPLGWRQGREVRPASQGRGARAEVYLLEGPESVDVTALARRAVTRGADLLGVAGGDGTQALVAAVAAEHGVPFLVISAGTRNTSHSISVWTATTPPPVWMH